MSPPIEVPRDVAEQAATELAIAERIRKLPVVSLGGLLILRADYSADRVVIDGDQVRRNLARLLGVDPDLVVPRLPAFPVPPEERASAQGDGDGGD